MLLMARQTGLIVIYLLYVSGSIHNIGSDFVTIYLEIYDVFSKPNNIVSFS